MAGELFIVIGVVAVIVTILILAFLREQKRKKELAAVAASLGFAFEPRGSPEILHRFGDLQALSRGDRRRTANAMTGVYRGAEARVFEFVYTTYTHDSKGHRQSHTHYVSVALIVLSAAWPRLTAVPESLGHKIVDALGGDDIDFESDEFSRKFWVKSDDRKFAFDILHPRAMELLLGATWKRWEMKGGCLCIWNEVRRLPPTAIRPVLDNAIAFLELIPSFRRPPGLTLQSIAAPATATPTGVPR